VAFAANNFAGITASNAIGGESPYTCRTQADVSSFWHIMSLKGLLIND
jgi:hypothetical protein